MPVENWGAAAAILLGSVVGGMLLGALYYSILAQEVRDGAVSLAHLLIAAKLSILAGANASSIAPYVAGADSAIGSQIVPAIGQSELPSH